MGWGRGYGWGCRNEGPLCWESRAIKVIILFKPGISHNYSFTCFTCCQGSSGILPFLTYVFSVHSPSFPPSLLSALSGVYLEQWIRVSCSAHTFIFHYKPHQWVWWMQKWRSCLLRIQISQRRYPFLSFKYGIGHNYCFTVTCSIYCQQSCLFILFSRLIQLHFPPDFRLWLVFQCHIIVQIISNLDSHLVGGGGGGVWEGTLTQERDAGGIVGKEIWWWVAVSG